MAQVEALWGPAGTPVNAGAGPHFDVLEVGHEDYVALIEADTAFWVLAPRAQALDMLLGAELPKEYQEKAARLAADLHNVRFGLAHSAVYFNPTERCNLDCGYCYLPREARRRGVDMDPARIITLVEVVRPAILHLCPLADAITPETVAALRVRLPGIRSCRPCR